MKLNVVLLGMHRALLPPEAREAGQVVLELNGRETNLRAVLVALKMPASTARIVFLEGQPITDDQVLHDGDTITFVSPVAGG